MTRLINKTRLIDMTRLINKTGLINMTRLIDKTRLIDMTRLINKTGLINRTMLLFSEVATVPLAYNRDQTLYLFEDIQYLNRWFQLRGAVVLGTLMLLASSFKKMCL